MKRVDVMARRAKEYQDKEAISLELRKWAIQREMTPKERYALGPTDTWHTPDEYYQKYMPLWCPLSGAWQIEQSLPPQSAFMTLVRGGIVETSYVSMTNPYTGKRPQVYVLDSKKTRNILHRLQQFPIRGLAWRFIRARLIQDTFRDGWMMLFKQVVVLAKKLQKSDWRDLLTGRVLNLQDHVELGEVLTARKMPVDLLPVAVRLLTIWVMDYLSERHHEKGIVGVAKNGNPQPVQVVFGQQQLINHQKGQLVMFYQSNLDRNTVSFRRSKAQSTSQK